MSRYYHVVDAEQVEIREAGVLPRGMKRMGDRWVYLTPHGILWPRSGIGLSRTRMAALRCCAMRSFSASMPRAPRTARRIESHGQ